MEYYLKILKTARHPKCWREKVSQGCRAEKKSNNLFFPGYFLTWVGFWGEAGRQEKEVRWGGGEEKGGESQRTLVGAPFPLGGLD